jgi:hypothetical protein
MSTIHDIARDFTALLRAGEFDAAAARYLADDVASIEPRPLPGAIPADLCSHAATRGRNSIWFGASHIDDLSVDGPFVTGDQFALFLDMMIVDRASGTARPFTEIALYTVQGARITEERYFYE